MDLHDTLRRLARGTVDHWAPIRMTWEEGHLRRAILEVVNTARIRVINAPLDTVHDVQSRAKMLCDLGQILVMCRILPSLLTHVIEYSTHHLDPEKPQVMITVRMPIATWREWSPGAVDFCEAMCQSFEKTLSATEISDYSYQCGKAGLNPEGCFFITMQYNKPPEAEKKDAEDSEK